MALPAPVQQPGLIQERREQVELGTIGVSLATQPQAWPLSVAASLLDGYRLREAQLPDLDVVAASRIVECHCTRDLHHEKVYAPFKVSQSSLPAPLLQLAQHAQVKLGFLPHLETLWMSSNTTTLFWQVVTNEIKEFGVKEGSAVIDIAELVPDKRVFSEEVKRVLAVSTAKEMRLYAVDSKLQIYDSELAISIEHLGAPKVRGTALGRIFFAAEKTGTAIWEFRYSAKETWFTPKVQRICHGEYGGFFGGLFGTPTTKSADAERILDFVIDDSTATLYALTTKSAIHAYEFSETGHSISLARNISSAQIRSALYLQNHKQQQQTAPVLVSIDAVKRSESNYIRLVAVTTTGDRIYFRANDWKRAASQLLTAYIQRPPIPETESISVASGRVLGGRVTYAVTANNVLASVVDDARTSHQSDMRQPVSFVELSGWFAIDGPVLAVLDHLVVTTTSVFRVRRRQFSERFAFADPPYALVQVYGPMQLCCGALELASQTSSRATRENAISAFFRFGGLPMYRRDQLQPGFLGHASVRLSSSFDGLSLYIVKVLAPLWTTKILGADDKPAQSDKLDTIYNELSGLVELLDKNRSFSEAMSERSSAFPTTTNDDAALLSQGEYKGMQAMGRLAKSSQEGIAFLRLVLTQHDTRQLFSYFDATRMNRFRQLTYGEFFTSAKDSDVARELVNSLVNYILNKGDSVDVITSVIQDRCASYCSTGDVLEYKALEYIHHAKQNPKHVDISSLARSVSLIRKAASTIQLETLRDVVRDYAQLKYYVGAVQASLAVAAEQDPANLAVGFLRQRASSGASTTTSASGATTTTTEPASKRRATTDALAVSRPISESELKFRAKSVVFDILFTEVLDKTPELALASSTDPAHVALVKSTDEVWHFALYDWYLAHNQQDQIALLDTPFVANYLQLGAPSDLRIANLLWKWHQRHGDLLAAADVLLDLARGPLVPTLNQRVEFLSRAMGYCQAQPQHTPQAVNMTTMVRAYLGLSLLQTDILSQVSDETAVHDLNTHLYTVSELFNDWAIPNGLYEVCFAIFEFTDLRDPVEIRRCWTNLLTKTRIDDDREKTAHYAHVAAIVTRLGAKYKNSEIIFSVPDLVPMLEQYSVDYTRNAPQGWIVEALVNAGIGYDVLYKVYSGVLQNHILEGEYAKHAERSFNYLKGLKM